MGTVLEYFKMILQDLSLETEGNSKLETGCTSSAQIFKARTIHTNNSQ
jgi:hypothetical protein